jgi:hypothetical protein
MGMDIDREDFEEADYERFVHQLQAGLEALGLLMQREGFGSGPPSVGAEVELCLVDAETRPLLRNLEVVEACADPRVTVELNRFNVEFMTTPRPLAGRPFGALGDEIREVMGKVGAAAADHGGRAVAVGILPTLRSEDVQSEAMTDLTRFRALSKGLRRLRDGAFDVEIAGDDPLDITCDDVTFEGANTSLQLHVKVDPSEFADTYNAAQIATGPALAVAGNSPLFLGHRLWEETRIALFKQAVDERDEVTESWRPARVSFGNGWVRETALELFRETVCLHAPLLPVSSDEDPLARVAQGEVPELNELRLHHGTVWRWNRAIFDPKDGGHLRIELRCLPAGPSVIDMEANMAFLVGLTFGLREEVDWMTTALPFEHAEYNFYRAAKHGMDAMLLWPSRTPPSPQPVPARVLLSRLIPTARIGLEVAGVDGEEADRLLAVIEARLSGFQTGAHWQRRTFESLARSTSRDAALAEMLNRYLAHFASGEPAHNWPIEEA